ncbi:RHS repeat domain-containing protein [Chitinophaga costaii]|nr:RHS repeat-associated core domain-containing protein [Chitinophaga costaii]
MKELLQEFNSGITGDNSTLGHYKKIAYNYDLVSGKVNTVSFNPGQPDAYYHRYSYDAENRITDVETSRDSLFWDHDAFYQYYKYGPLARTVLGQQQVQGMDYAYTLQGWIKGVNGTSLESGFEMGGDGPTTAKDAFGYALHYYGLGDYKPIGAVTPFAEAGGSNFKPLYNGNIGAMSVNLPKVGEPLQYNYRYDLLNRIIGMQTIRNLNVATNNWTPVAVSDFGETVTYDPNGNILHYNRNGNATWAGQSLNMDQMHYNYLAGTNKLDNIKDDVDPAAYTEDIDSQADANYDYDAIGNLVKDQQSSIDDIKWTVYGKISDIHKTTGTATTIHYTYDVSGNRISKTVNGVLTWYVRDATGNVMSIYTRGDNSVNTGHLTQIETDIYGSSRLGIDESKKDLEEAGTTDNGVLFNFKRGEKVYELGNHLGNVLSTIGDAKLPGSSNGNEVVDYTPKVQSAGDYYPFGMQEPGRTFSSAGYRYGFNGKENDNEVKGDGNQQDYGMRVYDPKVGKFLSVDLLQKKYPELTPYQFASNTPLQAIDLDGLEAFFIHGTASDPSRWTENSGTIPQYLRISGNTKYDATFEWGTRVAKIQPNATKPGNGYLNQNTDRETAAHALVQHIISSGLIDPKEGVVTLIGHSHGGNVAIQAADELREYLDSKPEYKDMKINIITISTPAENTPFANENPREHMESINKHLQLYNEEDVVQRTLSNVMKDKSKIMLPFLRTYRNFNLFSNDFTQNQKIDVSKYYGNHKIATSVEAHSFDANHPDLLNQVQPIFIKR